MNNHVRAVLFDLGGVYYTEGFRNGLFTIARKHGIEEQSFYETATEVIFVNGYVRGKSPERVFWDQLASVAHVDVDLFPERNLILEAFKPMPEMEALVALTGEQVPVGLLTDQCNWLYELDERDGLFAPFNEVITSYEEGYTKRDSEMFRITCQRMDVLPQEMIFFDDNMGNVNRARDFGIRAFLFEDAGQAEDILIREGVIELRIED